MGKEGAKLAEGGFWMDVCFGPQGSTKEEEGWKKMRKMCAPPPPSAHLPQLVKSILTLHSIFGILFFPKNAKNTIG
jgi:hypothetical protein